MEEERGSFIWVVLPEKRIYDEEENQYDVVGFSEPSICFTFPEMAEEWINQRQVKAFKSLVEEDVDLSLYCNFGEAIMRYVSSKNPGVKISSLDYDTYKNYKDSFFKEWNISEEYHRLSIYEDMPDEISDEKILDLCKLLDLRFFKMVKVKIIC